MKLLTLGFIFVAYVAASPTQIRPKEGLNEIESSKGYGYEKALDEEKLFESSREWDPLTDNGKFPRNKREAEDPEDASTELQENEEDETIDVVQDEGTAAEGDDSDDDYNEEAVDDTGGDEDEDFVDDDDEDPEGIEEFKSMHPHVDKNGEMYVPCFAMMWPMGGGGYDNYGEEYGKKMKKMKKAKMKKAKAKKAKKAKKA